MIPVDGTIDSSHTGRTGREYLTDSVDRYTPSFTHLCSDTNTDETDGAASRRAVLNTAILGGLGATLGTEKGRGEETPSSNRYIVGLDPGRADIAREQADDVHRILDFGATGQAVSGSFPEEAIRGLQSNPNVRYVEENGQMQALGETVPYGIEITEADVAIDKGHTGSDVSIAILDTGIDPEHETLEENIGDGWATTAAECDTGPDCDPTFFCRANEIDTCHEDWDDDNDHGTHVAGTAAAAMNDTGVLGVAPDATLHAVKVLDCCGNGSFDDIAAGIEWATDEGHDVINMSLGGDESEVVNDACDYAASNNVVLVAAAGNIGPCTDCVGHPAAHPEVIAVSATDENDELADFSSQGPEVEIAAPGDDVLSSVPRDDYEEFPGTSMASPHVAGAAAQVIANGTTDREDVRDKLKDAAEDIGLPSEQQGAGRLNVYAALDPELNTKWESSNLGGRPQYNTPAVDSEHVYVGGLQNEFYALDREDGDTEWTYQRGNSPGLSDSSGHLWTGTDQDKLLFGSGQGKLYAVDAADGTEHWSGDEIPDVGSAITSSPTSLDDTIFVGTNDGRVLAFDGETADEQWDVSAGDAIYSDLLAHSDLVYITTADGDLVVLDASSGDEQWRASLSGFGSSSPVLGHGDVHVAADEIHTYSATDSKNHRWSTSGFGGTVGSDPIYHGGYVYVGSEDGDLYSFNAADGSEHWTFSADGAIAATPAVTYSTDGVHIVVPSTAGTLYLLDQSGNEFDTAAIPDDTRASPVIDNGEVFLPGHSGVVYAFE